MREPANDKGRMPLVKSIALFTLVAFISTQAFIPAPVSFAHTPDPVVQVANADFTIPAELGTITEEFRVQSSEFGNLLSEKRLRTQDSKLRTMVFIQDAHDSLEAQENIAKIIDLLVKEKGVRTVFEEGYEGPVPTDKFFGFIKDPVVKQKVSYFLLDKLRIGGAEYAHINRRSEGGRRMEEGAKTGLPPSAIRHPSSDFQLIGVDDLKLYSENIGAYKRSTESRQETEEDLRELFSQITTLAHQYFPQELKTWLKAKERFGERKLPLLDYLRELYSLKSKVVKGYTATRFGEEYPATSLLLTAEASKDKKLIGQLNALDSKVVFWEMVRLEKDISGAFLKTDRDRQIFAYYQGLDLLRRLNRIEVTQDEYEALRASLESGVGSSEKFSELKSPNAVFLNTRKMADFIVSLTHHSLVLSKSWEQHIQDAVRFYDIARSRDKAIGAPLQDFLRGKEEDTAVLVFGGFHSNAIKEILKEQGISYVVISPRITAISKKHQDYYKQLMSVGHHSFEMPFLVARANKPPGVFFLAVASGEAAAVRSELRAITSSVEALGDHSDPSLIEQRLGSIVSGQSIRSEIRAERFERINASIQDGWRKLDGLNRGRNDPGIAETIQALHEYRLADALALLKNYKTDDERKQNVLTELTKDFPPAVYSATRGWNGPFVDLEEQTALFRGIEHALNELSDWGHEAVASDPQGVADLSMPLFWAGDPHYFKKKELFEKGMEHLQKTLAELFPGAALEDASTWSDQFETMLPIILHGNRTDDLSRTQEAEHSEDHYLVDHRPALKALANDKSKKNVAIALDNLGGETFSLLLAAWILIRMGKTVTIFGKKEPMLFSDTTFSDLKYSVSVFDQILKSYFDGSPAPSLKEALSSGTLVLREVPYDYTYRGEKAEGRKIVSLSFDHLGGFDAAMIMGELQYGDFMRQQLRRVHGTAEGSETRSASELNPFPRTELVFLKANKNTRETNVAVESSKYRSEAPTQGEFVVQVVPPSSAIVHRSEIRTLAARTQENLPPSAKDPLRILRSSAGKELAEAWIALYPNDGNAANLPAIGEVVDHLASLSQWDREIAEEVFKKFPILQAMHQAFKAATQDMDLSHPGVQARMKLFQPFYTQGNFLDVGTGNNRLPRLVRRENPGMEYVLGVDVEDQRGVNDKGRDPFIRMTDPEAIPVPDTFADMVNFTYVLHHVEVDREKYLREVWRVLPPGARVFVLEDTFSRELPARYFDETSAGESAKVQGMFDALEHDEDRLAFLHFVDAFNHFFVNRSRAPLVAGHYESMETWNKIFVEAGFKIIQEQYLGFSRLGSRNPVARGMFVLEKPATIHWSDYSWTGHRIPTDLFTVAQFAAFDLKADGQLASHILLWTVTAGFSGVLLAVGGLNIVTLALASLNLWGLFKILQAETNRYFSRARNHNTWRQHAWVTQLNAKVHASSDSGQTVRSEMRLHRLEAQLEVLASPSQALLSRGQVEEILGLVRSGALKLFGEDLDVVQIVDGKEKVAGAVDLMVVHLYGLLHRSVDAFVRMPNKKFLILRRPPGRVVPPNADLKKFNAPKFSIPGGHPSAGETYREGIEKELIEEMGLPEEWKLEGALQPIGVEGEFMSPPEDLRNRERRAVYLYKPTPREAKLVWERNAELTRARQARSKETYKQWLHAQQVSHPGRGEAWSYHEFSLDEIQEILRGKEVILEDQYGLGDEIEESARIVFAEDLLPVLLKDERILASLRNEVRITPGEFQSLMKQISPDTSVRDQVVSKPGTDPNVLPRRSEVRDRIEKEIGESLRGLDEFVGTVNRLRRELVSSGKGTGILSKLLFEATKDDADLRQRVSDYYEQLQKIVRPSAPASREAIALRTIQTLGIGPILMISPEVAPFSMAGGMAKVLEGLPQALVKTGAEVHIVTFLFDKAQGTKHKSAEVLLREGIQIGGKRVPVEATGRTVQVPFGPTKNVFSDKIESPVHSVVANVYRARHQGVTIDLLYAPELTDKLYPNVSSSGQLKRAIFLSRGSLEVMRQFDIRPDFIFANDWMAAPTFAYLKADPIPGDYDYRQDEHFYDLEDGFLPKLGYVVHNLGRDYQARFFTIENSIDLWPIFRLQGQHYGGLSNREGEHPEYSTRLNLARGGIVHSQFALTVSQSYAQEIQTPEKGEGVHQDFLDKEKVYGISNGIDLPELRSEFVRLGGGDPQKARPGDFMRKLPSRKAFALRKVQEKYGMAARPDAILVSMVGRLADQKGVELVAATAKDILDRDPRVQLLIAGSVPEGDPSAYALRDAILELQEDPKYHGRVGKEFEFVAYADALEIYLATDLFLMPSKYEPGGLTYVEGLAGGAATVAHKVGGMGDILSEFDADAGTGDAFFFTEFTPEAFLEAVSRGIAVMLDPRKREMIRVQAASATHDWSDRVPAYLAMLRNEAGVSAYDYPHLRSERELLEKVIARSPAAEDPKRSDPPLRSEGRISATNLRTDSSSGERPDSKSRSEIREPQAKRPNPQENSWVARDSRTGTEKGLVYQVPRLPKDMKDLETAWRDFNEMVFEFPKILEHAAREKLPVVLVLPEKLEGFGPLADESPWIEGARTALAWASAYFRFKELGNVDVRVLQIPVGNVPQATIAIAMKKLLSKNIRDDGKTPELQMEARMFRLAEALQIISSWKSELSMESRAISLITADEKDEVPLEMIRPVLPPLPHGKKRIVVTGAAGFIGINFVKRLLDNGDQVIALDNMMSAGGELPLIFPNEPGLYFQKWDVSEPFDVEGPVDQVIHLASLASPPDYYGLPLETLRSGLQATRETVKLALRKQARFLFTSTSEVYGDAKVHPQAETYEGNVSPFLKRSQYDQSKRGAETLMKLYAAKYAEQMPDFRIARLFNTYGPYMRIHDGRVVTNFIDRVLTGTPIEIYGNRNITRSFGYVDDTVEGLMKLLRTDALTSGTPIEDRVFNIGNDGEFTLGELADLVNELGQKHLGRTVPVSIVELKDPSDPTRRRPDLTRARRVLRYDPNIPLREGLEKTFLYFLKNYLQGENRSEIRRNLDHDALDRLADKLERQDPVMVASFVQPLLDSFIDSKQNHDAIVLGSGSPRKKKIASLMLAGRDVRAVSADVDEYLPPKVSHAVAATVASFQKAFALLEQGERGLLITNDTFVYAGEKRVGKINPGTSSQGVLDILRSYGGKTITAFSGLAVINTRNGEFRLGSGQADLRFKSSNQLLDHHDRHVLETMIQEDPEQYGYLKALAAQKVICVKDLLGAYVAQGKWKGKAGGFGIQDREFWLYVEKVEGNPLSIVGLPSDLLARFFNELGIATQDVTQKVIREDYWPMDEEHQKIHLSKPENDDSLYQNAFGRSERLVPAVFDLAKRVPEKFWDRPIAIDLIADNTGTLTLHHAQPQPDVIREGLTELLSHEGNRLIMNTGDDASSVAGSQRPLIERLTRAGVTHRWFVTSAGGTIVSSLKENGALDSRSIAMPWPVDMKRRLSIALVNAFYDQVLNRIQTGEISAEGSIPNVAKAREQALRAVQEKAANWTRIPVGESRNVVTYLLPDLLGREAFIYDSGAKMAIDTVIASRNHSWLDLEFFEAVAQAVKKTMAGTSERIVFTPGLDFLDVSALTKLDGVQAIRAENPIQLENPLLLTAAIGDGLNDLPVLNHAFAAPDKPEVSLSVTLSHHKAFSLRVAEHVLVSNGEKMNGAAEVLAWLNKIQGKTVRQLIAGQQAQLHLQTWQRSDDAANRSEVRDASKNEASLASHDVVKERLSAADFEEELKDVVAEISKSHSDWRKLRELASNDHYWVRIAALSKLVDLDMNSLNLRTDDPEDVELRSFLQAYMQISKKAKIENKTYELPEDAILAQARKWEKEDWEEFAKIKATSVDPHMEHVREAYDDLRGELVSKRSKWIPDDIEGLQKPKRGDKTESIKNVDPRYFPIARWTKRSAEKADRGNNVRMRIVKQSTQLAPVILLWQFAYDIAKFKKNFKSEGGSYKNYKEILGGLIDAPHLKTLLDETRQEWSKANTPEKRGDVLVKVSHSKFNKSETIKMGAILVGGDGVPIAVGYNGEPEVQGADRVVTFSDLRIDAFMLNTRGPYDPDTFEKDISLDLRDNRPDLRRSICGEQKAILFAKWAGISLAGSVLYTTYDPCNQCLQLLANTVSAMKTIGEWTDPLSVEILMTLFGIDKKAAELMIKGKTFLFPGLSAAKDILDIQFKRDPENERRIDDLEAFKTAGLVATDLAQSQLARKLISHGWQGLGEEVMNSVFNQWLPYFRKVAELRGKREKALKKAEMDRLASRSEMRLEVPTDNIRHPRVVEGKLVGEWTLPPGVEVSQKRFDRVAVTSEEYHSIVPVIINGETYFIGHGDYLELTLSSGKKIYWSGQHNLSYSLFFKHFDGQAEKRLGSILWRHADQHQDSNPILFDSKDLLRKATTKRQIEFGLQTLNAANYLGFIQDQKLARVVHASTTEDLAAWDAEPLVGGVLDIDLDILIHPNTGKFQDGKALVEKLAKAAAASEVIFMTNSSEREVAYLRDGTQIPRAFIYLNPKEAIPFGMDLVQEIARQDALRSGPALQRDGNVFARDHQTDPFSSARSASPNRSEIRKRGYHFYWEFLEGIRRGDVTFAMIKADGLSHKEAIIQRFQQAGFEVYVSQLMRVDEATAREFYKIHRGKPFYEGLIKYITSGEVIPMLLVHSGGNAAQRFNEKKKAIRKELQETYQLPTQQDFDGHPVQLTVFHASDPSDESQREPRDGKNQVEFEAGLVSANLEFVGPVSSPATTRSELRASEDVPVQGMETTRRDGAETMVRAIRKNGQPATVFVDAADLGNLSPAQKQEYLFVALSNKSVRIIVYNEHGQARDKQLDEFLSSDRVTRTDQDLSRALAVFGKANMPTIHLSKQILPDSGTVRSLGKRVMFFKQHGEKGGTLAVALLWAISGAENARLAGVNLEKDGFWTVAETLLSGIQRAYDNSLVFAIAA